jgi:hypothetical protein
MIALQAIGQAASQRPVLMPGEVGAKITERDRQLRLKQQRAQVCSYLHVHVCAYVSHAYVYMCTHEHAGIGVCVPTSVSAYMHEYQLLSID